MAAERQNILESMENAPNYEWEEYKYVSYMIFFSITLAMLVLNCFADKRPLQTKYPRSEVGKI